ncbi:T9SS type A sorting domain-containing protein [Flaviaesturariibacter flavus]|uniref:T9SS type A sorting domain-containing protein n=1 Tax=Flaviaesturariibacter flavus TaxID=2502780 RepID=A0A4V2NWL3_9BACT|nr:YCF48-related protein [Flaviaesturariibacter flavus]TCJ17802.1 T9SS type A sorting domain-containing protein [Flaviaesturariibacter flavus]
MKTFIQSVLLLAVLFSVAPVSAQGWTLVTPVKTQSAIRHVAMTSPSTGYAIDNLDDRLLRTRDGGASWQRQGFVFSSAPTGLWMFSDSVGIISTNTGTFFKSNDAFATRSSINTSSGSTKAMRFLNGSFGYAVANNVNIKTTTDGGATWTLRNTGNTNNLNSVYFLDATNGYACGVSGTILKTTDGGQNWTALTTNYTYAFTDIWFTTPLNGVAVGGGYISRTTDGGTTWTPVTPAPTTQTINRLYFYNNTLMALCDGGTLLRSTNNGASWTSLSVGTKNLYAIDINAFGQGLIGAESTIYKTTNGGQNWTVNQAGTQHSYLNKVSFANDQVGVAVGWQTTNGMANALVRTTDGGKTWTGRYLNASTLGVHLRADGAGVIGGGNGYNERTTDYGQNFFPGSSQPAVAVRAVWSQGPASWILGGGYFNGGIYRTTNSGASYTYTPGGNILEFFFPTDLVGYAGGEGGSMMKTTDGGATWTNLASGTTANINSIYFLSANEGYVASTSNVSKTTDGGATWTQLSGFNIYALHFYTADSGYAVTGSGSLLKTLNGGVNWSTIASGDIADMSVRDAAFLNGRVVAVGLQGDVFVSYLTCNGATTAPTALLNNGVLYSTFATGNQWYKDGSPVAGATGNVFNPVAPGVYHVVNTNAQGCTSAASNTITVLVTAVPDLRRNGSLRAYPNPAPTQVTVDVPQQLRMRPVVLRTATGAVVWRRAGMPSATLRVDLSGLPTGIYFLSIGDNVTRLVHQRP